MKVKPKQWVLAFIVIGVVFSSHAEDIVSYDVFGKVVAIGFGADSTLGTVIPIELGSGVEEVPSGNYATVGWSGSSINLNNYLEFGFENIKEDVVVQSVSLNLRRDSAGPRFGQVRMSVDGGPFEDIGYLFAVNEAFADIEIALTGSFFPDESVRFRLYTWWGAATGKLFFGPGSGVSIKVEGINFEVKPRLVETTPLHLGGIGLSDTISLMFDEEITPSGDFATLDCMMQGDNRVYSFSVLNGGSPLSGTQIDIMPSTNLIKDDVCELTLNPPSIVDARGNSLHDDTFILDDTYALFFTTDQNPPSILTSSPAQGQVSFPGDENLTLQFSEPVLTPDDVQSSGDGNLFANITCNSTSVPFTFFITKYDNIGTDLTLIPDQPLPSNASCALSLFDLIDGLPSSNALAAPTTITFTTAELLGDVNLDGSVNYGDAIVLEKGILGLITLSVAQQNVADLAPAGGDNAVSLNDLLELQRMLLGL